MKATVTPILAAQRDRVIKEFFAPEFASHQLGQPGVWRGFECQSQGLSGRVVETVLDNLLCGRSALGSEHPAGPWRHPGTPVGWKFVVETDYRHNSLWALGNEEHRGLIELAHSTAVAKTFEKVDHALRRAAGYRPDAQTGAIYAAFMSGVGDRQVPGLKTSIIVANGHLRNDGSVVTFPTKALVACGPRLYAAYLAEFVPRVFFSIGRVGDPGAEVPKNLFRPLAADPVISGHPTKDRNRIFVGQDLFVQWKRQAELRGFGIDKVADVFNAARTHAEQFGEPKNLEAPWTVRVIRDFSDRLWQLYTNNEHSQSQGHGEKRPDTARNQ